MACEVCVPFSTDHWTNLADKKIYFSGRPCASSWQRHPFCSMSEASIRGARFPVLGKREITIFVADTRLTESLAGWCIRSWTLSGIALFSIQQ